MDFIAETLKDTTNALAQTIFSPFVDDYNVEDEVVEDAVRKTYSDMLKTGLEEKDGTDTISDVGNMDRVPTLLQFSYPGTPEFLCMMKPCYFINRDQAQQIEVWGCGESITFRDAGYESLDLTKVHISNRGARAVANIIAMLGIYPPTSNYWKMIALYCSLIQVREEILTDGGYTNFVRLLVVAIKHSTIPEIKHMLSTKCTTPDVNVRAHVYMCAGVPDHLREALVTGQSSTEIQDFIGSCPLYNCLDGGNGCALAHFLPMRDLNPNLANISKRLKRNINKYFPPDLCLPATAIIDALCTLGPVDRIGTASYMARLKGYIAEVVVVCHVEGLAIEEEELRDKDKLGRAVDFTRVDGTLGSVDWTSVPEEMHKQCEARGIGVCYHLHGNKANLFGLSQRQFDRLDRGVISILSLTTAFLAYRSSLTDSHEFTKIDPHLKLNPSVERSKIDFDEKETRSVYHMLSDRLTRVYGTEAEDLVLRKGKFSFLQNRESAVKRTEGFMMRADAMLKQTAVDERFVVNAETERAREVANNFGSNFKNAESCKHNHKDKIAITCIPYSDDRRRNTPIAARWMRHKVVKDKDIKPKVRRGVDEFFKSYCKNTGVSYYHSDDGRMTFIDKGKDKRQRKTTDESMEILRAKFKSCIIKYKCKDPCDACEALLDMDLWLTERTEIDDLAQKYIMKEDMIPMSLRKKESREAEIQRRHDKPYEKSEVEPCKGCMDAVDEYYDIMCSKHRVERSSKVPMMPDVEGLDRNMMLTADSLIKQVEDTVGMQSALFLSAMGQTFLNSFMSNKVKTHSFFPKVVGYDARLLVAVGREMDCSKTYKCRLFCRNEPSQHHGGLRFHKDGDYFVSNIFKLNHRLCTGYLMLPGVIASTLTNIHDKCVRDHPVKSCTTCKLTHPEVRRAMIASHIATRNKKRDSEPLMMIRYTTVHFTGAVINPNSQKKFLTVPFDQWQCWLNRRISQYAEYCLKQHLWDMESQVHMKPFRSCLVDGLMYKNAVEATIENYLCHFTDKGFVDYDHALLQVCDKPWKETYAADMLIEKGKIALAGGHPDSQEAWDYYAVRGFTNNIENDDRELELVRRIFTGEINHKFTWSMLYNVGTSTEITSGMGTNTPPPRTDVPLTTLLNTNSVIPEPTRTIDNKKLKAKLAAQAELKKRRVCDIRTDSIGFDEAYKDVQRGGRHPYDTLRISIKSFKDLSAVEAVTEEERDFILNCEILRISNKLKTSNPSAIKPHLGDFKPSWRVEHMDFMYGPRGREQDISKALFLLLSDEYKSFHMISDIRIMQALEYKPRMNVFNGKPDLQSSKRTKNLLYIPTKMLNRDPMSTYFTNDEIVLSVLSAVPAYYGFGPKEQLGPPRELPIQFWETKLCHHFVERYAELVNSMVPGETLSKGKIKDTLFHNLVLEKREGEFVLHGCEDHSGWGTRHIPLMFATSAICWPYSSKEREALWISLCKASAKDIEINKVAVERCLKGQQGDEPHRKYLAEIVASGMNCGMAFTNMGQGMLHETSSFTQSCASRAGKKVVGIDVDALGGSDDRYVRYSFPGKPKDPQHEINKFLSCGKLFNCTISDKSGWTSYAEFNSQFISGGRTYCPTEKYLAATLNCSASEDYVTSCQRWVNAFRNALTHGATYLAASTAYRYAYWTWMDTVSFKPNHGTILCGGIPMGSKAMVLTEDFTLFEKRKIEENMIYRKHLSDFLWVCRDRPIPELHIYNKLDKYPLPYPKISRFKNEQTSKLHRQIAEIDDAMWDVAGPLVSNNRAMLSLMAFVQSNTVCGQVAKIVRAVRSPTVDRGLLRLGKASEQKLFFMFMKSGMSITSKEAVTRGESFNFRHLAKMQMETQFCDDDNMDYLTLEQVENLTQTEHPLVKYLLQSDRKSRCPEMEVMNKYFSVGGMIGYMPWSLNSVAVNRGIDGVRDLVEGVILRAFPNLQLVCKSGTDWSGESLSVISEIIGDKAIQDAVLKISEGDTSYVSRLQRMVRFMASRYEKDSLKAALPCKTKESDSTKLKSFYSYLSDGIRVYDVADVSDRVTRAEGYSKRDSIINFILSNNGAWKFNNSYNDEALKHMFIKRMKSELCMESEDMHGEFIRLLYETIGDPSSTEEAVWTLCWLTNSHLPSKYATVKLNPGRSGILYSNRVTGMQITGTTKEMTVQYVNTIRYESILEVMMNYSLIPHSVGAALKCNGRCECDTFMRLANIAGHVALVPGDQSDHIRAVRVPSHKVHQIFTSSITRTVGLVAKGTMLGCYTSDDSEGQLVAKLKLSSLLSDALAQDMVDALPFMGIVEQCVRDSNLDFSNQVIREEEFYNEPNLVNIDGQVRQIKGIELNIDVGEGIIRQEYLDAYERRYTGHANPGTCKGTSDNMAELSCCLDFPVSYKLTERYKSVSDGFIRLVEVASHYINEHKCEGCEMHKFMNKQMIVALMNESIMTKQGAIRYNNRVVFNRPGHVMMKITREKHVDRNNMVRVMDNWYEMNIEYYINEVHESQYECGCT